MHEYSAFVFLAEPLPTKVKGQKRVEFLMLGIDDHIQLPRAIPGLASDEQKKGNL